MTNVTNLDDTLVSLDIRSDSLKPATSKFETLRNLAHKIETSPCTIRCETSTADGSEIHAEFNFCCAAEKIIFQLNYQFNSKYKI